jgi:hypothetical protein
VLPDDTLAEGRADGGPGIARRSSGGGGVNGGGGGIDGSGSDGGGDYCGQETTGWATRTWKAKAAFYTQLGEDLLIVVIFTNNKINNLE